MSDHALSAAACMILTSVPSHPDLWAVLAESIQAKHPCPGGAASSKHTSTSLVHFWEPSMQLGLPTADVARH